MKWDLTTTETLKKLPDYEGLDAHIEYWNKFGIPYGIKDLIKLAQKYNTPIPQEFKYSKRNV